MVPCAVVVDERLPSATVEMSKTIFKRARLKEGEPVVISSESDRTQVEGRLGDALERCEIAMGPKLAIFLGIMEGDEVVVGRSVSISSLGSKEAEDFVDILSMPQDRLAPLMGDDLRHFSGLTVDQVLEHLERHGNDFAGRYLVSAPNPDGVGIPRGEVCEDPSLDVKIWDPSQG